MSRKDDPRKSVKLQQGDIALRTELTPANTVTRQQITEIKQEQHKARTRETIRADEGAARHQDMVNMFKTLTAFTAAAPGG